MRTISANVTNQLDNDRQAEAQITVRKNRLSFGSKVSLSAIDSGIASSVYNMDSTMTNSGILRVAAVNSSGWKLAWQWISNPDSPSGSWTTTSRALLAGSKPGIFGTRVFYQDSSGNHQYADFSGLPSSPSLGSATLLASGSATRPASFSPISTTVVYRAVLASAYQSAWQTTEIDRYTVGSGAVSWGGRLYNEPHHFLAAAVLESSTGREYFFFNEESTRGMYLVYNNGFWGDPIPVHPMDVVDAYNCQVTGASEINNQIYVCGIIIRETGSSYHYYSRGGPPFTTGRDVYIGNWNTSISSGDRYYAAGGKLLWGTSKVYYCSLGYLYKADRVHWTGYNHSSDRNITNINNIKISSSKRASDRLTLDIMPSEISAPIEPGAEIILTAGYNTYQDQIGQFAIDGISIPTDEGGTSAIIVGRSSSIKRLSQYTPEASFELLSQTKQMCNPSDLSQIVRVTGLFDKDGNQDLICTRLNENGILYSVEMPSRNGIVKGKFYSPNTANYYGHFGVALNFYRDTNSKSNGIFALYIESSGQNRIYLYSVNADVWTELTYQAVTLTRGQWNWIMLEFRDGKIQVKYRADSGTTWSSAISNYLYDVTSVHPWRNQKCGRAGLFIKNVTDGWLTPGINSTQTIIPLHSSSPSAFPSGLMNYDLVIDDERITCSRGSADPGVTLPSSMDVVEYQVFPEATHPNTYWTEHLIYQHEWAGGTSVFQELCKDSTCRYALRSVTVKGKVTVKKVKVPLAKVGSPGQSVYCWLCTDAVDNGASIDEGSALAYASVAAANVGTSFTDIEFNFGAGVDFTNCNFWIVLTNVSPSGGTPPTNSSNYYKIAIETSFVGKIGLFLITSGTGFGARNDNGLAPYKIYGDAPFTGYGYDIFLNGTGTSHNRKIFEYCALVAIDGPGKGASFTIIDYDYAAPDDWVPSRSYVPPEKWQDHVGDLAHGSWASSGLRRFVVSENPRGVIGPGTKMSVYRGVIASTRGANGTTATSHGKTDALATISRYVDARVAVNRFGFYSSHVDMRLEDVAKEIARKAGVYTMVFEKDINTSMNFNHSGWSFQSDASTVKTRTNFIAKLKVTAGSGKPAVGFHFYNNSGTYTGGHIILINTGTGAIEMYNNVQSPTLAESVPTLFPYGEITISVQDTHASVWAENALLASFTIGAPDGSLFSFCGKDASVTIDAELSALDMFIDNFVLDSGSRGVQLLDQLIGQKRVFYQDNQYGQLRLYKSTTSVGSYALGFAHTKNLVETDFLTRLQAEGVDIVEAADTTLLDSRGNLFSVMNLNEANTRADMLVEVTAALTEATRSYTRRAVGGACDPRIEPGDTITLNVDGNPTCEVDTTETIIVFTDNEVLFDINMELRDV